MSLDSMSPAAFPSTEQKLGLYPVVDSVLWIERLLNAGVRTLQLRVKTQPIHEVEQAIITAIALGKKYQARLFINDYWQLAIKHQAYGVHLGQEDLEIADLNQIRDAGLRLGISTHDEDELARALALRPSYVALGHIFPTKTKQMPSKPQGLTALQYQVNLCHSVPTVAIGGISAERVADVLKTGVGSVAMVTAITQASDWHQTTLALLQQIEGNTSLATEDNCHAQ